MKFALIAVVLFLTGSVWAVTDSTSSGQDSRAAKRDARQEFREGKNEAREKFREDKKEAREEFKERMKAIRDEKKLAALERIETHLANINKRRTDHFLKVLTRLERILEKISNRADRAQENGKDVSGVRTAIAAAQSAIDAAKTGVKAQAEKIYEVSVDSESTARNDVGEAKKKLQEDLRKVMELVSAAREAVHDALKTLVPLVAAEPTPTP